MDHKARARYLIVNKTDEKIILRDIGPWHLFPTITNDVENVVSSLVSRFGALDDLSIYYRDSEGEFNQIITENNRFKKIKIL